MRKRCTRALALGLAALGLCLAACGQPDAPAEAKAAFASPAATFSTFSRALADEDWAAAWACYSASYRAGIHQDDMEAWTAQMRSDPNYLQSIQRREISAERAINDRIGYLLFDSTTLDSPQQSPFFYFIREAQGWMITTHLDTVFHRELESSIARGEFDLQAR